MALSRGKLIAAASKRSRLARVTSTVVAAGRHVATPPLAASSSSILQQDRCIAMSRSMRHTGRSYSSNRSTLRASIPSSVHTSASNGKSPMLDSSGSRDARHRSAAGPLHFSSAYNTQASRSTFLPTPLPPEVTRERSAAFQRHGKVENARLDSPQARKSSFEGTAKVSALGHTSGGIRPLSIGDLAGTPLHSLYADESFYTPPQTIESLAILRACLNTGLTNRARKIFDRLREEHAHRSASIRAADVWQKPTTSATNMDEEALLGDAIGIDVYNAMIGAYLLKALGSEKSDTSVWLQRAWNLFDELEQGTGTESEAAALPVANATSFALMAAGLVKLSNMGQSPRDMRSLPNLLVALRRSPVSALDLLTAPPLSPGQDHLAITSPSSQLKANPQMVLTSLISSASNIADSVMLAELKEARIGLESFARARARSTTDRETISNTTQKEKQEAPTLRPVMSTGKREQNNDSREPDVAFNLKMLKENLSVIYSPSDATGDPYERQRALEFAALTAARDRFQETAKQLEGVGLKNAGKMRHKTLQGWMWEWYCKLETTLAEDIDKLRANSSRAEPSAVLDNNLLPFLCSLTPGKLALITIMEVMRMQGTGGVSEGVKTARAIITIGRGIEAECYAERLETLQKSSQGTKNFTAELKKRGISDMRVRKDLKKALERENEEFGVLPSRWTSSMHARVGSYVAQHLLNVATIHRTGLDRDGVQWNDEQPAFYSAYQYVQGRRLGLIKLNPAIERLMTDSKTFDTLHPRHLPMLVPPKPWLTYDSGGYYSSKSYAMRFKDNVEQLSYLRAASDNGNLDTVLAGLDILGTTAWTINDEVFNVMAKVWNSGEAVAGIPPLEPAEDEPVRPADYDSDIKVRGTHIAALRLYKLRRAAIYSERCSTNYKLEIARAFLKERFYFPHNMDFRGRAYPLPPHFNHIGDDVSRGLLKFANAKPLGVGGLRWLRIHLANVFGYDKVSFKDREDFAIEHADQIRKCAQDPLGEGRWWQSAEDPWQALATCFELDKALRHPQGPEAYESNLPVHQDGTCNGLQHYAALGGDLAGAQQVNLSRGERPSDVYTGVADLVIESVARDAANGNGYAEQLKDKISRKLVKQTVMTTVYGVTLVGAREQVRRKLADMPEFRNNTEVWAIAAYLAKSIIESIGDLFAGARAIQFWLKESANIIAKSIPPARLEAQSPSVNVKDGRQRMTSDQLLRERMTAVIWTTPLGLPVVQPYRRVKRKQLVTKLQSVYLDDPNIATQVSSAKQASAFPPNFVHSLDATHMFLTALECQNAQLTFASVHDSYWTHACDVDTMSDIIRDTFVRLHSADLLVKLREEFLTRYKGHRVPIREANEMLRKRQSRSPLDAAAAAVSGKGKAHGQHAESLAFDDSSLSSSADSAFVDAEAKRDESVSLEDMGGKLDAEGELDSAASTDTASASMVPLADLLPPIPKKGEFDVNEIKRSLYFFS